MVRVLVLIFAAGLVLSVATLTAAFAIGGPDILSAVSWNMASGPHWHHHGWDGFDDDDDFGGGPSGPQATRTLAWSGGERLDIDVPADVQYTQASGAGSIEVSGPERLVSHVVVEDGHIRYDHRGRHHHGRQLTIVMHAPDVNTFDLSGRTQLKIEGYKQDQLNVDISGSGSVDARGETGVVKLDISGRGDADLGNVKSKGADVEISGSGDATVSPTDWAKLQISGRGEVTLTTHPPKVQTEVSGSGEVHQAEGAPAAPEPPAPPPAPAPAKGKAAKKA
jgi:hypothetical protein